jgi:hypothetical protein
MNNYDQRQYEVMKQLVSAAKNGTLNINRFISDMESLLALLEEPNPEWKKRFRREWANIDTTYAVAASRDPYEMKDQERARIKSYLSQMESLLDQIGV